MFDIAREILAEIDAGRSLGVVMVTRVFGSAPRTVGSAMAVTADGRAIGSISGGCIESEAFELARATHTHGQRQSLTLGGTDDFYAPGLACGGSVEVLVLRIGPADTQVADALRASLGDQDVTCELDAAGEPFVLSRPRKPRMVIVGAVDFSGALAEAAQMLGYRVTVVDPRPVFATGERFPAANEVVVAWPGEYLATQVLEPDAAVCVLTHDTRMDVPALVAALSSPARYVGAMGSRRTHEQRLQRLREQGVPEQDLARLHSPIGLDLGGSTPAQTAIAIVAEIIADREGGTGVPLSETAGPVHRAVARRSGT